MSTKRLMIATAFVAGIASQALPADQHHIQVYGRPQIFDVNPPTTAYVEVTSTTFTASSETLNGMEQMYGGCTQVTRLTTQEAQELVDMLNGWLLQPDEELLLFEKRLYGQKPSYRLSTNQQRKR
jgi:hypothetical protein